MVVVDVAVTIWVDGVMLKQEHALEIWDAA